MADPTAAGGKRVKVYVLNDQGRWDDRGTGYVRCEESRNPDGLVLRVVAEGTGQISLCSRVKRLHEAFYQLQGDTIISWAEEKLTPGAGVGSEMALSFAEAAGCRQVWDQICVAQGVAAAPDASSAPQQQPLQSQQQQQQHQLQQHQPQKQRADCAELADSPHSSQSAAAGASAPPASAAIPATATADYIVTASHPHVQPSGLIDDSNSRSMFEDHLETSSAWAADPIDDVTFADNANMMFMAHTTGAMVAATSNADAAAIAAFVMPPPDRQGLEALARIMSDQGSINIQAVRERIVAEIASGDYVSKLCDVFGQCEDLCDVEGLAMLYHVVRCLFIIGNNSILEILVNEKHVMDIIGCLEYEPELLAKRHSAAPSQVASPTPEVGTDRLNGKEDRDLSLAHGLRNSAPSSLPTVSLSNGAEPGTEQPTTESMDVVKGGTDEPLAAAPVSADSEQPETKALAVETGRHGMGVDQADTTRKSVAELSETPTPDTPRPGTPLPDTPRPGTPLPDTLRPGTPLPDTFRSGTSRPDASRPGTPMLEAPLQTDSPQLVVLDASGAASGSREIQANTGKGGSEASSSGNHTDDDSTAFVIRKHRDFLERESTYKAVVNISDPSVTAKIHQNFRVSYIKDVILLRVLDDAVHNALSNLIIFNNVDIVMHFISNQASLTDLFKRLTQAVRLRRESKTQSASSVGSSAINTCDRPRVASPGKQISDHHSPEIKAVRKDDTSLSAGDGASEDTNQDERGDAEGRSRAPGQVPSLNNDGGDFGAEDPKSSEQGEDLQRNLTSMLGFLNELCSIAKNQQLPMRNKFHALLRELGVLEVALDMLRDEESALRLLGSDLLSAAVVQDQGDIRAHMLRNLPCTGESGVTGAFGTPARGRGPLRLKSEPMLDMKMITVVTNAPNVSGRTPGEALSGAISASTSPENKIVNRDPAGQDSPARCSFTGLTSSPMPQIGVETGLKCQNVDVAGGRDAATVPGPAKDDASTEERQSGDNGQRDGTSGDAKADTLAEGQQDVRGMDGLMKLSSAQKGAANLKGDTSRSYQSTTGLTSVAQSKGLQSDPEDAGTIQSIANTPGEARPALPLRAVSVGESDELFPLLGAMVDVLCGDTDSGVVLQVLDLLRTLVDPATMRTDTDMFLDVFYEHFISRFLIPIREVPLSDDDQPSAGVKLRPNENIGHLCDLLSFCVKNHSYRIKYFVLGNNVAGKVLRLAKHSKAHVRLSALRFVRACIDMRDDVYDRYILRQNLLKPVMDLYIQNKNRDNLTSSAVLELVHFVHCSKRMSLLAEIVEKYADVLEPSHVHCTTYADARKAYEEASPRLSIQGPGAGASGTQHQSNAQIPALADAVMGAAEAGDPTGNILQHASASLNFANGPPPLRFGAGLFGHDVRIAPDQDADEQYFSSVHDDDPAMTDLHSFMEDSRTPFLMQSGGTGTGNTRHGLHDAWTDGTSPRIPSAENNTATGVGAMRVRGGDAAGSGSGAGDAGSGDNGQGGVCGVIGFRSASPLGMSFGMGEDVEEATPFEDAVLASAWNSRSSSQRPSLVPYPLEDDPGAEFDGRAGSGGPRRSNECSPRNNAKDSSVAKGSRSAGPQALSISKSDAQKGEVNVSSAGAVGDYISEDSDAPSPRSPRKRERGVSDEDVKQIEGEVEVTTVGLSRVVGDLSGGEDATTGPGPGFREGSPAKRQRTERETAQSTDVRETTPNDVSTSKARPGANAGVREDAAAVGSERQPLSTDERKTQVASGSSDRQQQQHAQSVSAHD